MHKSHNPHVRQQSGDRKLTIPFTRSLGPTYPRMQYRRRKGALKTVVHWGQRKLLMSEIEFLLLADEPNAVVVYAGAAPGIHVKVLLQMFSGMHFVLVDPGTFRVAPSDRVTLVRGVFSDDLAAKMRQTYAHAPLLFISDVRKCDWGFDNDSAMQRYIEADMVAQEKWHAIMRPKMSLLKFRLPYTPGATAYLEGDLRLPVWGPVTTTECRLIVERDAGRRIYDHTEHEQQMFFFNTMARSSLYCHEVEGVPGLDHCYDCTAEVKILEKYLLAKQISVSSRDIASLSIQITQTLSSSRDLTTPNRIQTEGRRIADTEDF